MKRFIFIIILVFNYIITFSQELYPYYQNYVNYQSNPDKNLFLSPDVYSFHKRNFYEINYYTGKINLEIPFFEIELGDIKVPIKLQYNSGGIKIDDVSSNVGMGWNLNAGGNIYRKIIDVEDWEYIKDYFSEEDWDLGSVQYQYVSSKGFNREIDEIENPLNPIGGILPSWYPEIAHLDAGPDEFNVIAPGLNTSFIVDKNYELKFLDGLGNKAVSSIRKEIDVNNFGFDNRYIKGLQNYHLNFNPPNHPPLQIGKDIKLIDYDNFNITNSSGVKYFFNSKDIFESISGTILPPMGLLKSSFLGDLNYKFYKNRVSSWHLNRIEDSRNNVVNFIYEEYDRPTTETTRNRIDDALRYNVNAFQGSSLQKCVYGHMPYFPNYYWDPVGYENFFKVQEYYSKSPKLQRLKEINWSGGSIHFEYNLNRLDDIDNNKALTKIIIKDFNLNIIKSFKLNYSYFISKENCNSWFCKRLKLENIEMIGSDDQIQNYYSFDYEYSHPLPKVKSLQQDFLGYYNNNNTEYSDDNDIKSPTLYYYKNKEKYSILPFQLNEGYTNVISGDFSLAPNIYSLQGLLKKIIYPTGGWAEFEYENHTFNFEGNEYLAGGARIKKQIIKSGEGDQREINYEYIDNNKSSGFISNLPIFGYPFAYDYNKTNNNVSFAVFDKSKNLIELTNGSFVGYSLVKEKENGKGFTEYYFHSPKDFPNENDIFINAEVTHPNSNECINFYISNSAYPSLNFINNDILRGKLFKERNFNNNNNIVSEKEILYDHKIFNTINWNYRALLNNYNDNPHFPDPSGMNYFFNLSSKLNFERNLPKEIITKQYFNPGIVETKEVIAYDNIYPLVKERNSKNSLDEEIKIVYKYPQDLIGIEQNSEMAELVQLNKLSEPIIVETYNNLIKTSEFHLKYAKNQNTSHLLLPIEEHHKIGLGNIDINLPNYRKIKYLKYDKFGNIEEFQKENELLTRIIWGYRKDTENGLLIGGLYPIAKIINPPINNDLFEGFIYNLKNSSLNLGDEFEIQTIINQLILNYPDSVILGYSYDPLIGIKLEIGSNLQSKFYKYDSFGRLVEIKDHNGNILKQIDYHYKP